MLKARVPTIWVKRMDGDDESIMQGAAMAEGCEQAKRNEQQAPRCPRFPIHAYQRGEKVSRPSVPAGGAMISKLAEKKAADADPSKPSVPSNVANHVRRRDFAWSDETRSPKFRVMRLATSGNLRRALSGGSIAGKRGAVYICARSDPRGVPVESQRDGSADNMSSEPKAGSNRRRGEENTLCRRLEYLA